MYAGSSWTMLRYGSKSEGVVNTRLFVAWVSRLPLGPGKCCSVGGGAVRLQEGGHSAIHQLVRIRR
jgi:hypothetical protein